MKSILVLLGSSVLFALAGYALAVETIPQHVSYGCVIIELEPDPGVVQEDII